MRAKQVLDTNGLMAYLRIGRNNAQALMRRKDFPSVQITPRRRVVTVAALDLWMEREAKKKKDG